MGMPKEVVITGLGPVAPTGVGKEKFWEALKGGKSGIRRISLFEANGHTCQVGGEIDSELISSEGLLPQIPSSRSSTFIIAAARLALEDAGIAEVDFASLASGIYVGVSTTDMGVIESEYTFFKESGCANSEVVSSSSPHAAASEIGAAFKCPGKVLTFSTACSSGLLSIIYGVESILRGEVEMVLAGGGDAPITPFVIASFSSAGLLSTSYNDVPSSASRPFDARRDGAVLAEGAGMLLLESAENARLRGAKVYGKVAGGGISNAFSPFSLKKSFYFSMSQALQNAHLSPEMIDYISSNGSARREVDRAEVKAIKKLFGRYAYNIPVSSIKSMIGNPLAAAGPLQVISAIQAIQEKCVPPTINYEYPEPQCDLDFVANEARTARVHAALVNIKGMGGNNSSLLITGK